jgi:hypothetical protein
MQPIQTILQLQEPSDIYRLLTATKPAFPETLKEIQQQWDVYSHDVMNSNKRKKKRVKESTGKRDSKTGEIIYREKFVDRCRIAVPIQQVLTNRGVGFLFSNPVRYAMSEGSSEAATSVYRAAMSAFTANKIKYKENVRLPSFGILNLMKMRSQADCVKSC